MKLTGERPLEDQTPPALLALHDAGYREVIARLGQGLVVDVGCGVGTETVRLEGSGRRVLGVDYDPPTAAIAARVTSLGALCGDGAQLPVRTGAADFVCSSHLVEHFHEPEGHVAELARVLDDEGTAFVITPNAPADFENPYHVHLFEPTELAAVLGRHFRDVKVLGLDGDEVVKADFERRRRAGARLLALDPFGWRHRLPRSWYVALHAMGRRMVYPLVNRRAGTGPEITDARFHLGQHIDPSTLVLFAIARRPRRASPAR